MPKISALAPLNTLAADDEIAIIDKSAQTTKRITVQQFRASIELGWIEALESWVFTSYNATTRIGVIGGMTGATAKYSVGQWLRLAQATGGTKYGMITAVTATSLSVNFFSYTLNNEAITAPFYSMAASPTGAPLLPYKFTDANGWTVRDFGTRKEYSKAFARGFNINGSAWTFLAQENLPAGFSTVGAHIVTTGWHVGDSAITANCGAYSSNSGIQVQITNQYGGAVGSTLYVHANLTEA